MSMYFDVDTAVTVPVNAVPLCDSGDFKTTEESVAYNAGGMDLEWHFWTTAGVETVTAVTPTTGGDYDWSHTGNGMYKIEIPASGGASINNNTEGYGYFVGKVTGVLDFRGPTICFRASALNDSLIDAGTTGLLGPTTAGRTLDVSAGGEAGLDWANVGSPTTTVGLSGTTVKTATDVETDTADIQTRLPAALVNSRMDSTIDGTGMEAGAVTAVQSGLATAAAVAALTLYASRTVVRGTVGTATTPSTTQFTPSALSPSGVAADQFKGRIIVFDNDTTTTALRGQATDITASSAASLPLFTFTALTTAPANGDTFSIV